MKVKLGEYELFYGSRPLVIAEAGINHNGEIALALEMIEAASECGADIIKFQTHIADAEMLPDVNDAGSHIEGSLYSLMKKCELSLDDHVVLKEFAEKHGILFLSTPFSVEAVELLEKVGVEAYKIGSGEITNMPFLRYVALKNKPMIVSTGTATWDELCRIIPMIKGLNEKLVVLQCTSNYPTACRDVNLGVISMIMENFNCLSGLSDHCANNYVAFGAVAAGAIIVEKHFTLSRKLPGPDQKSSIEPVQLKELVAGVRCIYEAMGTEKKLNDEALKIRNGFSESVVSLTDIKKGEILVVRKNIWVKRPGTGIPSYKIDDVNGKTATRDIPKNKLIEETDFK